MKHTNIAAVLAAALLALGGCQPASPQADGSSQPAGSSEEDLGSPNRVTERFTLAKEGYKLAELLDEENTWDGGDYYRYITDSVSFHVAGVLYKRLFENIPDLGVIYSTKAATQYWAWSGEDTAGVPFTLLLNEYSDDETLVRIFVNHLPTRLLTAICTDSRFASHNMRLMVVTHHIQIEFHKDHREEMFPFVEETLAALGCTGESLELGADSWRWVGADPDGSELMVLVSPTSSGATVINIESDAFFQEIIKQFISPRSTAIYPSSSADHSSMILVFETAYSQEELIAEQLAMLETAGAAGEHHYGQPTHSKDLVGRWHWDGTYTAPDGSRYTLSVETTSQVAGHSRTTIKFALL